MTFTLLIIAILTGLLLHYTMLGRGIYAIGGNPEVAKRAGFNIMKIQFFVYTYIGNVACVVLGIFILRAISSGFNIIGFSNHFRNVIWGSMLVLVPLLITLCQELQIEYGIRHEVLTH